jgi:hypothetical protein
MHKTVHSRQTDDWERSLEEPTITTTTTESKKTETLNTYL